MTKTSCDFCGNEISGNDEFFTRSIPMPWDGYPNGRLVQVRMKIAVFGMAADVCESCIVIATQKLCTKLIEEATAAGSVDFDEIVIKG